MTDSLQWDCSNTVETSNSTRNRSIHSQINYIDLLENSEQRHLYTIIYSIPQLYEVQRYIECN